MLRPHSCVRTPGRSPAVFRRAACRRLLVLVLAATVDTTLAASLQAESWMRLGLAGEALHSVASHPTDPDVLLAGASSWGDTEGVFRSLDGGRTWEPINSGLGSSTSVLVITFDVAALDPGDPSSVPILIGVNDPLGSTGIYKSTDLGDSWQPAGIRENSANSLVFDPQVAGTGYASFTNLSGGIFKTTDGGASWNPSSSGIQPDGVCILAGCVLSLAIDPGAPTTLYGGAPNLLEVSWRRNLTCRRPRTGFPELWWSTPEIRTRSGSLSIVPRSARSTTPPTEACIGPRDSRVSMRSWYTASRFATARCWPLPWTGSTRSSTAYLPMGSRKEIYPHGSALELIADSTLVGQI